MGRSKKIGLDYFPFDVDTFQDIKIRKLIKYQGGKAVAIYASLLCLIYKSGYYMRWDKELPFIISEMTGFEEVYISEVIKSCMVLGLFSKELFESDCVLTSAGIQERYYSICRQLNRKCDVSEFSLISSEKNGFPRISSEEKGISSEEKRISSEEKRISSEKIPQKKRKEKEKKSSTDVEDKKRPPSPPTLEEEIEALKGDMCWLDQLQVLHRMDTGALRARLDEFRLHCAADGKGRHESLTDAKQHFNNWLRITATKQGNYGNNRGNVGKDAKQEANEYAMRRLYEQFSEAGDGIPGEVQPPF